MSLSTEYDNVTGKRMSVGQKNLARYTYTEILIVVRQKGTSIEQ